MTAIHIARDGKGPELQITPADPGEAGVRDLILRHLEYGLAHSPPEDAHALEPEAFADPAISLFAARRGHELLAIGALRRLDQEHAELKGMHTVESARGEGLGRAMLSRLLAEARADGYRRVSLETGSAEAFGSARSLYRSAGFTPCEPFADYRASSHSVYLTIVLWTSVG